MSSDVIVTVTLNTALHVSYYTDGAAPRNPRNGAIAPVSRPTYRAGGRGVTVARVLRAFGHDVLAAGLAGGMAGELIGQDLARSGVPAAFTQIRGESRRVFRFAAGSGDCALRFGEPSPYITTEELGRFAADYRKLLGGAAAVVLCGSLPDGLPADMYASLVRYAAEARVPVILDAGGEELLLAARNRPSLAVTETGGSDVGHELLRLGPKAVAVVSGQAVRVVTPAGEWAADIAGSGVLDRGGLVAGLVPGELLGWSWPDRLRHALALAAALGSAPQSGPPALPAPGPAGDEPTREVDLGAYERLLERVAINRLPLSDTNVDVRSLHRVTTE